MRNISLRNSIIICKFAAAKSNLCSIRSDFPLGGGLLTRHRKILPVKKIHLR